ncbi:stage II sporulation protein D [Sporomusaceae bacterium BoRhaA]|uniref:stage II sporulation protein D n=1 Tax=Pelorhabdus rhamnosifermentans TaxID=2772457 RepID=UPI001C063CE6|nr:stage II sporulation protein D [Pelorhabdus rhamnosifermentans]MBU2698940.1 stage II sporulation protein D [Pelorhabdus rhamnosifermentans]
MRSLIGAILAILVLVIIIPALVVRSTTLFTPSHSLKSQFGKPETVLINVYIAEQGRNTELELEDYIKGVVAAEMPADFEPEALKAQAVAARTYAVKNMVRFGGAGLASHVGSDVSTDTREGQAWQSSEQLKQKWGANYSQYASKISRAVDETRGIIVTYQGEPIHAVFHSTSGERTASAKEVWGFDYPYLVSVSCQWDRQSPRYRDEKKYSIAELEQRLGSDAGVVAAVQGGGGAPVQVLSLTESGRVDQVRLGTKTFNGQELRDKLALRSTNFTIEVQGDSFIFHTIGYGHGVGLSQYGSNGMAKEGMDFKKILTYYYTGVALKNIYGS